MPYQHFLQPCVCHDHCSGLGDQAQAGARALLRKRFLNIEYCHFTGILSTLLHNLIEADNTFQT